MAQTVVTVTQLQNASADAQTLEVVVNGDENTDVTTRLGNTYPTLDKALKLIMQHGLVGSTPYKTYQDLVNANIPVNTYAVVTNDSDTSKNGLYLNDNGTLKYSELNTVPQLMTELNKLINFDNDFYDNQGRKVAWGVTDEADKLGAWIAEDGTVNASNIQSIPNGLYAWAVTDDDNAVSVGVLQDGSFAIGNGLTITSANTFVFAVTDDDGRASFAVDKNGHIISPDNLRLDQAIKGVEGSVNTLANANYSIDLQKTDYMQIIGYGQSLSRGAGSSPIISTNQPYKNVMFKSGVLHRYMDDHDFSDFVPLVEVDNGNGEGETPMSALVNNTVKMLVADGKSAEDWRFAVTSSGMGGQPIEVLSKGQPLYAGVIEQLKAGVAVANGKGESYSMWAMTWTQGEDNYGRNTPKQEYKRLLKQLHSDIIADVKDITKQDFSPIMIMYQVAAHRKYGKDDNQIAIAQYECCEENPSMMMACPIYQIPHTTDDLHLTGDSSYQLGLYYSKALKYVIDTGKKWQPLKPKHIIAQGGIIDIEFNKTGLQFDTTQVAQTHNYGFDLYDIDNNTVDIISQVQIIGDNRVRLRLSSNPPKNTWLSYAKGRKGDPLIAGNINGARGNLRDNADPVGYADSAGKTRHLHNWCVMFTSKIN